MTLVQIDSLAHDRTDHLERRSSRLGVDFDTYFSTQAESQVRSDEATELPQDAHRRLVMMWARAAHRHAALEEANDPPGFFATVAGIDGAWAHGSTPQEATSELLETLIDWCTLKLEHGDDDIPTIDGMSVYFGP